MVIRFDKPMRRDNYSVVQINKNLAPPISNPSFDESGTVFTIELNLEPSRNYELGLNWPNGGNFVSTDGRLLKYVLVKFRTRAATAAP
jgi:hypothetical protein